MWPVRGSRAPGASPLDPLVDALVHGQDMARPLGRTRDMPAEAAVAALDHVVAGKFYGGRGTARGARPGGRPPPARHRPPGRP
ncbi:hypothetical protein SMD20_48050 [Nonomuraea sp. LP-02]|uniref:hypothetical protein n=1 Tax=Nonomuraea sp. LP-02 TaxID=3097960 RepID=UPI002E320AE6|nr:hypothetical protein [Nonomuraea sp. LP-02]MED7932044.1 hypothetical protein [Nonomuraea sp. LP-02]